MCQASRTHANNMYCKHIPIFRKETPALFLICSVTLDKFLTSLCLHLQILALKLGARIELVSVNGFQLTLSVFICY